MKTRTLEQEGRYVLLASLAEGRRVLEIGCADGRGILQLAEAGAEELTATVLSPPVFRKQLEDAGVEGVELVPDHAPPLRFDRAAFDLVICQDFTDRLERNDEWLREARRIVAPDGYLAIAIAQRDGQFISELAGLRGRSALDYETTYARLANAFGGAAIFGQAPIVASMFYDVQSDEEEPGLVLDGSLLDEEGENPGWYVLVFGPEPPSRDDLLIVRHSFAGVVRTARGAFAAKATEALAPEEIEALQQHVEWARGQASELMRLQGEVETLRQELEAKPEPAPSAPTASPEVEGQLAAARQVLASQEREIRSLSAQRLKLEDRLALVRVQFEELRRTHESRPHRAPELDHALKVLRDETSALRQQQTRAQQAEERLSIERIAAYRAQNDLQRLRDDTDRRLRELERSLETAKQEAELTKTRLSEAQERRKEAERVTGAQADEIAQLRQSLQGAEQMFERTKAELVRIEQGAEERIAENKQLTEALLAQSQAATEARLNEELQRARAEKSAAELDSPEAQARLEEMLAEARAETEAHLAALEKSAEEKLEAAKAAAQAQIDAVEIKVTEALAARDAAQDKATETERQVQDLNAQLETMRATNDEAVEQIKNEARQKLATAKERVRVATEAKDDLQKRILELEAKLQAAEDEVRRSQKEGATPPRSAPAPANAPSLDRLGDAFGSDPGDAPREKTVVDHTLLAQNTKPAVRPDTRPTTLSDAPTRPGGSTDDVGRRIEPALEELEDLLQRPPAGQSTRR